MNYDVKLFSNVNVNGEQEFTKLIGFHVNYMAFRLSKSNAANKAIQTAVQKHAKCLNSQKQKQGGDPDGAKIIKKFG